MIKLNGRFVEQKTFADGTLNLKIENSYYREKALQVIEWYYEDDSELFTIICLAKKLSQLNKILYLPYLPHARMDRIKNQKDVFTLKYFCDIINSLDFSKVCILDPHSDVGPALLNNVEVISPLNEIKHALSLTPKDVIVVFPDNGAEKRYSSLIEASTPFTYCTKHRDWESGQISNLTLVNPELVKNKPVLIIDDICSYGGTFIRTTNAVMDAGAKEVYLYATHCENNILKGGLLENPNIKKVFTTSSIFTEDHEKITTFSA